MILVADDISVAYGGVQALDGASLELDGREVVGLVGPNGAGKTTLVNVISGFSAFDAGRLIVGGESVSGKDPKSRASRGIRRTFQAGHAFAKLTVEQNMMAAATARTDGGVVQALVGGGQRRSTMEFHRRVAGEYLEMFGLQDVAMERAADIGHAQLQALGVAMALCTEPLLACLDEPFGGLSPDEAQQLSTGIRAYRESADTGFLIIDHALEYLFDLTSRVVCLHAGRVLTEGTPAEILQDAEVERIYLG